MSGICLLVRIALRRDRWWIVVWAVALAGVMAGSAASTASLYPTHADLEQVARTIASTRATLALYGPPHQLDVVGGLVMWKPGGLCLVLAGLCGLLTVVRHTRAQEEIGLTELVGAGAVGRLAPLAAALLSAVIGQIVIGLAVGAAMVATTGGAGALTGAVGAGLSFALIGVVFAAVTGVSAQLARSGSAANGLAGGALAVSYVLRATADGSTNGSVAALRWLSPLGWVQRLEPYAVGAGSAGSVDSAGPRWSVLLLPLVLAIALSLLALGLRARRDLGAAWWSGRPGPPVAGPRLSGPIGVAWRLHRGDLAAWCVGFGAVGALLGGLASGVGSLIGTSAGTRELLERLGGQQGLTDTYLSATMSIAAVGASAYALLTVLRLGSEQAVGRIEPMLAGAVSRRRVLASHLLVAALGTVLLLTVLGLAGGLAQAMTSGSLGSTLPRLLGAALALVPVCWLIAAVGLLLVAGLRRPGIGGAAAWTVFGLCVVLGPLGAAIGLPRALQDLSPYTHVPHLPSTHVPDSTAPVLIALTLGAAVLALAAAALYRRRDLAA